MGFENEHLKKVTKGAMIVFIGMFIGRFFGYIIKVVMVRLLGADLFGLFIEASAIIGIVTTICLLGVPAGLSRFISFYVGKKNIEKTKGVIKAGFKITIPMAVIGSILTYIMAPDIAASFFKDTRLTPLLLMFSIAIPFSVFLGVISGSFRGLQHMKYKVLTDEIIRPLSTLFLIVIFFFTGLGILGAVTAYIIGYILASIVGIMLLIKLVPLVDKNIRSIFSTKELLSFSWPLIISGYLWMIIAWTDTIVLGFFRNAHEVGTYNIAMTTAAILLIVADAFIFIFLPVITNLYAKGKNEEIVDLHSSVMKWILMINIAFFMVMISFPDNVLSIIFGQGYGDASFVLVVLASGFMARILGSLSTAGIIAMGKTKQIMLIVSIGAIINFILNVYLIPEFGMVGAAIATSVSFALMAIIRIYLGHRYLGFRVFEKSYIKAFLSGGISILVFYFIVKSFYFSPPWWILAVTFPLFLFIYGTIFLLMKGLEKNDLLILKSIEKKTGIRVGILRNFIKKFL